MNIASHKEQLGEIVRFGIIGVTATILQYGVYLVLLRWLHPTIANTVGYIVSFLFNYVASTRYTFRVKSTARRGAGFAFAHLINYTLQTLLLSLFLWLGLSKPIAMLPVFAICVPINFLLVRFFLKRGESNSPPKVRNSKPETRNSEPET
ncbi:MAG: GtrA family protein [Prevotella sp.]|nr:GtrA family protein [Prevotella sp.]